MTNLKNKMRIVVAIAICLAGIVVFSACGEEPCKDCGKPDEVVINGIKWATRNVGSIGTFVTNPEDYGNYYDQYYGNVCPTGWRVPKKSEFESLISAGGTWTTQGNKGGFKFGDAKNNIFLPAAGLYADGALTLVGSIGYYLSSTTYSYDVYYLKFDKIYGAGMWLGDSKYSVRCVKE